VCLCSFLIFSFVVHKFGFREWTASNVEGFSKFRQTVQEQSNCSVRRNIGISSNIRSRLCSTADLKLQMPKYGIIFLFNYLSLRLSFAAYLLIFIFFFLCSCAFHSSLFLQQSLSILVPFVPFIIPLLPLLFPSFRPIFQLLLPEVLRTPVLPFSNSNHDGLNSFVYAVTRCKSIIRFRLFKMSFYCVRQTGNNDSMCVFELISNYQYETTANYIKM
jgi:hypothetical protein